MIERSNSVIPEVGKSFIVGFPSAYAVSIVEVLARETEEEIAFLCPSTLIPSARLWVEHLRRHRKGVSIVEGEPYYVDFGLTGREYLRLKEKVKTVFHFYPPSNDTQKVRKALDEVLELCFAAPNLERLVCLSFVRSEGAGRIKGPVLLTRREKSPDPWAFNAEAIEKILIARKTLLPWTIARCAVPAPSGVTFMAGKEASAIDMVMQVLVVLSCQVDLKALKKASSRFVPLTPTTPFAYAAAAAATQPDMVGEAYNFIVGESTDVRTLRRIIEDLLAEKETSRERFAKTCRQLGPELLDIWCSDHSPQQLLRYATASKMLPSEAPSELLRKAGVPLPTEASVIMDAAASGLRAVEEAICSLEARKEPSDAMD